MTSEQIYTSIYHKLLDVVPDILTIEGSTKSVVGGGIMDLCFEFINRSDKKIVIALTHYYKAGGDLVPDPDMSMAVYPDKCMAEALTFQDSYVYRQVYTEYNGHIDLRSKKDLNEFLDQWLTNLIEQGHKITAPEPADE